ncbi:MAG: hypothetical protein J6D53_09585 [Blautia sp.]|nr:hypothetical protein [Blautia sp.]
MKRTVKSRMMMVVMASVMLFTGAVTEAAVTREVKAANGVCPDCRGYADDIVGPGIYWFEAEETYYNGSSYLSVVKLSDTKFRIYDENGHWVEFSRDGYSNVYSDGSVEYIYGKTMYTYHPYGCLTYHYRHDNINYYTR